jgi:negative regulator of flagellin synthesis FlgM
MQQMKIDPSKLHCIGRSSVGRVTPGAVEGTGPVHTDPAARVGGADQVMLSQRAQEVQAARAALAQVPEVRQERVAELKASIEGGTYKVEPDKVAERILNPRT